MQGGQKPELCKRDTESAGRILGGLSQVVTPAQGLE